MTCPLCLSNDTPVYYSQKNGVNWELYGFTKKLNKALDFYKCVQCHLIFKDPSIHLNPQNEKLRYDLHANAEGDVEYEKFLSQLVDPHLKLLLPNSKGLDFGCGAETIIENLFKRNGFDCSSYDPFFYEDKALLTKKYDFITACEVVEHFYEPRKEFELLFSMLNPKGILGVKTALVPKDFANWWYHKDPTHVVFYSRETLSWIANKYSARVEFLSNDVVLFILAI